jgi:hypothetical protein
MSPALIYNTKRLQAPLKFGPLPELPDNTTLFSYKEFENSRLFTTLPDPKLLEVLK